MKSSATVPALGQLPRPKLFYRIQEVSKLTGLKPYVLRYWESEFKELAPGKDASDQRRYRVADIEVVLAIRKLLYEDRFTIEGARKRLKDELRKVRGEAPAAARNAAGAAAAANASTPSEQMQLEDFIPAPLRETARRAQAEARRSGGIAARPRVLNDAEPLPTSEPGTELEAGELYDSPAPRPSAMVVSIAPEAHAAAEELATAQALAEARDEFEQQRLEGSLRALRKEVAELLAMLT